MPTPAGADNSYLSVEQVAARYGVSVDTIWRWKRNGNLPRAVRVGPGTTRWKLGDLLDHESRFQTCLMTDAMFLFGAHPPGAVEDGGQGPEQKEH